MLLYGGEKGKLWKKDNLTILTDIFSMLSELLFSKKLRKKYGFFHEYGMIDKNGKMGFSHGVYSQFL